MEGSLAKRYWMECKTDWKLVLFSPFVVSSLAAGDLKTETFDECMLQEVQILRALETACDTAAECVDDHHAKVRISFLHDGVNKKLKMHDLVVRMRTVQAATAGYTEFPRATASGEVDGMKDLGNLARLPKIEKTKLAAYTLGAMIPCVRLYAFLDNVLKAIIDDNEGIHPHEKWIIKYSSYRFQAAALQTEELLDILSASLTGEEIDTIEKVYHRAMKLVVEFFLSQPLAQGTIFNCLERFSSRYIDTFKGEDDPNLTHWDGHHSHGVLSKAKVFVGTEDPHLTFYGRRTTILTLCHGNGRVEGAENVNNFLFQQLTRLYEQQEIISGDIISNAFAATENGFCDVPTIVGFQCLVCIIWKNKLFLGNLGTSGTVEVVLTTTSRTVVKIGQRVNNPNAVEKFPNDVLEIRTIEIEPERLKIFMLASEGLWDWLTNQEVVETVKQYLREVLMHIFIS